MPPDESPVLSDQGTARLIMVEGKAWVSHEFHQRFIAELRAENEARCQHCPAPTPAADERSFMCTDCAEKADTEVQDLRDEVERLRTLMRNARRKSKLLMVHGSVGPIDGYSPSVDLKFYDDAWRDLAVEVDSWRSVETDDSRRPEEGDHV